MPSLSQNKIHDGTQFVYSHPSAACQCDMKVGVFIPDGVTADAPALIFLSGLTCTEQNFATKAGAQRVAAELGLVLIAPDTSPRDDDVPDAKDEYDFGKGAGFYLDATQQPWSKHYNMETYIRDELTAWMAETLPVDMARIGITGHSMGGHGALTLHLKNPGLFKTCSAFAPIVAPSHVPWGHKAFERYLGGDPVAQRRYDACELVADNASSAKILIDQGGDDQFLEEQLQPERFQAACSAAGQKLKFRLQPGYDHSYYFIATFIEDHLHHHFAAL